MKIIFWLLVIAAVIIVGAVITGRFRQNNLKISLPYSIVSGNAVNIDGFIACLPHNNFRPGEEPSGCFYGIQTADGKYYALIGKDGENVGNINLVTGSKVQVAGIFVSYPAFEKAYKINGTLLVNPAQ